ncbi:hypothetical protein HDU76_000284 [Blyttiomyces sp. JEL0837]|nr:hypothetical protein HDU76_000284 [Blyttiomyces sp. JEL0837]
MVRFHGPSGLQDADVRAVVLGGASMPANTQLGGNVAPACDPATQFKYSFSSENIISGGDPGRHITLVTGTVYLTCTAVTTTNANVDLQVYSLGFKGFTVRTETDGGNPPVAPKTKTIDDASLSNAFIFKRNLTGTIVEVEFVLGETDEILAIKKGVAEAFNTNLAYDNGFKALEEVGVVGDRVATYYALSTSTLSYTQMESHFNQDAILQLAPQASINNQTTISFVKRVLVDNKGDIKESLTRGEIRQGQPDIGLKVNGPDIVAYVSADLEFSASIPVGSATAFITKPPPKNGTALGSLTRSYVAPPAIGKKAGMEVNDSGMVRRTAVARRDVSRRVDNLLDLLVSRPWDGNLKKEVENVLGESNFDDEVIDKVSTAAWKIVDTVMEDDDFFEIDETENMETLAFLLKCLSKATSQLAHMKLVDIVRNGGKPSDLASIALSLVQTPTASTIQALSAIAKPGSETGSHVLTLSSLLSKTVIDQSSITNHMRPHWDYALTKDEPEMDDLLLTIHSIGNLGESMDVAVPWVPQLMRHVQHTRSKTLMEMAFNMLKPLSNHPSCRQYFPQNHFSSEVTVSKRSTYERRAPASQKGISTGSSTYVAPIIAKQWNSTASPYFNFIEPLASRQKDVDQFSTYKSYLVQRTRGWSLFSLETISGVFAGVQLGSSCGGGNGLPPHSPDFKLYAGTIFVITTTAGKDTVAAQAVIQGLHQTTSSSDVLQGSVVITVGPVTIFTNAVTLSCSKSFNKNLLHLPFVAPTLGIAIPVSIVTITLSLQFMADLDINLYLHYCLNDPVTGLGSNLTISAIAQITGTIGISVIGIQAALSITGALGSQVIPVVTGITPNKTCGLCIELDGEALTTTVDVEGVVGSPGFGNTFNYHWTLYKHTWAFYNFSSQVPPLCIS